MAEIVKKYKKGDLTIVWKPGVCIHSTVCWKAATGLPAVFNPFEKPWIKVDNATEEELMAQIKKCPSGALSFYVGEEGAGGDGSGEGDADGKKQ
ncbi:MAG: (4Fe-4S)-binding protein [Bacteroidetes bacterium]|nr:(4Fe-4S)-binding protein [Bacteroidota bacterium]